MKVQKRRRRENKTDYAKRIKLLKSGLPRLVFRKTNKYLTAQYVTSTEAQDSIKFGINSKQLLRYSWPERSGGSLKSLPAAYFLGLLAGKKIAKEKMKTPILDFGMIKALHKSKIYAFLKGLEDAGIKTKHEKEIFPEEDRIMGKHMKEDFSQDFDKIKSKINES